MQNSTHARAIPPPIRSASSTLWPRRPVRQPAQPVFGIPAQPLRDRLPALTPDAIAMLGPRDHLFRQAANVPTVAGRVWLRPAGEVSADPAGYARLAVGHAAAHGSGWWLHIDLDVLARSEFAACGAAGEIMLAGGLVTSRSRIRGRRRRRPAARASARQSVVPLIGQKPLSTGS
jgi:hypothetical protein